MVTSSGSGLRARLILRRLVPTVLIAAERPALIPVADRIGRPSGVCGEGGVAEILGPELRPVAIPVRGRIVPPAALVVGGAVEDLVADVRVFEPDAHQLREVLGPQP